MNDTKTRRLQARSKASTAVHTALADQLEQEIERKLLTPLSLLLDEGHAAGAVRLARRQLAADAQMWAAQLLGPDEELAVTLAHRLLAALYADGFEVPLSWWRTPLGRVIARRIGHPSADSVSRTVAGAMLGITRQGVQDLINRGKLARHPDGGVSVASVRERINRTWLQDSHEAAGCGH